MKTKILFISLITISLCFTSCSGFLDEDNKTGYTEDVVYSTKTGLDGLIASCYSYSRAWYGKEAAFGLCEGGSDTWLTGYDHRQKILIDYTGITPEISSNPENMNACLDEYWELFYSAVNVCNTALKYVELADPGILSEAQKSAYLGEAYFLRAFYYWHLVETWGPVQINREPVSTTSTEGRRDSEQEVYAFMLEDVDNAINYLKNKTAKDGHVNLYAAMAFKARLLLYKGSKFNDNQAYAEAAKVAEDVISQSGASFYSDYDDCWSGANEDGIVNKEVLWFVEYSRILENNVLPKSLRVNASGVQKEWTNMIKRTNNIGGNASHLMFVGVWNLADGLTLYLKRTDTEANKNTTIDGTVYNLGAFYQPYSKGFTRFVPSGYLLDVFNDETDQRYQASFRDVYYISPVLREPNVARPAAFPNMMDTAIYMSKKTATAAQVNWANGRYRLLDRTGATGALPLYTSESAISPTIATGTAGAENSKGNRLYIQLKKFDDYTGSVIRDLSSRDAFVIRLSEIYLIAAEAYMMSGNSGNAITKLNDLRAARAIPGKDNSLTAAETAQVSNKDISMILDERARELCGEQQRWFDLKRTGTLINRVKLYNESASKNIQNHHVLRPIPQPQMDAITNREEFRQNDGY